MQAPWPRDTPARPSSSPRRLRSRIPGAGGEPHALLRGAEHFLHEDVGPELAEHLVAWMR